MGAFFTNIQISIENKNSFEIQNNLINYISKILKFEGFEITNEREHSDREIIILSHSNDKWLGIYDEATEDQNIEYINSLTSRFSKEFQTRAINILVHDSDVLKINYFSKGNLIDKYCNNENYFTGKKKKIVGKPEKWKIFLKKKQIKELSKIWKNNKIFAENILINTLNLFEINYKYCIVGYNYLEHNNFDNKIILKFKLKEQFKIDNKEKGLPVFDLAGYSSIVNKLSVGDNFQLSNLSVRNTGGESQGVIVYIYGPAVEKGYIFPNNIILRKIKSNSVKTDKMEFEDFKSNLNKEIDKNGMLIYTAVFSELKIEAGYKQNSIINSTPGQFIKKSREHLNQNINIISNITAIKSAKDDIYIGISPISNPKNGFYGQSLPLEIIETESKPLNFKSDLQGQRNHVLLNQKNVFFSYIIFDSINENNKQKIINAIENYHRILLLKKNKEYNINYIKKNEIYPKHKRIKAEKLFSSMFWKSINLYIDKNTDLQLLIEDQKDINFQNSFYQTSGIKLINSIPFFPNKNNISASLIFWNTFDENSDIERIKTMTFEITNNLIKYIDLIQSFTGCWGDNPMSGYGTIYENCCGIDGSYAHLKEWNKNYLRGITEHLCLSDSLLKKININKIKKIAEITSIGNSINISLNNNYKIYELEKLLIPILPSKEKYLHFQQKLLIK